jgi:hypothetical protein
MFAAELTTGIAKTHRIEETPLSIFAKDKISAVPLTAYIRKGDGYYKTRSKSGKLNVSFIKRHSSNSENKLAVC